MERKDDDLLLEGAKKPRGETGEASGIWPVGFFDPDPELARLFEVAKRMRDEGDASGGGDSRTQVALNVEGLSDAVVAQLLESVGRVLPQRPDLADLLRRLIPGIEHLGGGKFGMKKKNYAARLEYSERYLDKLIEAGLPHTGKGKALRILVPDADDWMRRLGKPQEGEIERDARLQARRGKGRSA